MISLNYSITQGDKVIIPSLMVNRLEALWGPDAQEWNPERWMDGTVPIAVKSIPGIYGNMLSFLGGSHACIGWKFSLYE
jgi:cytochrome P450